MRNTYGKCQKCKKKTIIKLPKFFKGVIAISGRSLSTSEAKRHGVYICSKCKR